MSYRPTKGKGAGIKWLREHASYRGDECLYWPLNRVNGYGAYSLNGKIDYAHRWMCEAANGPAPTPKHHAAHECGRGQFGCVNPAHLVWKTVSDNQRDRKFHGTRNVHSRRGKISQAQADEIRALKGQKPQREIAAIYGISRSQVSWIMCGRAWTGKTRGVQRVGEKWLARIKIGYRAIHLGMFETEEAARAAYVAAAAEARAQVSLSKGM